MDATIGSGGTTGEELARAPPEEEVGRSGEGGGETVRGGICASLFVDDSFEILPLPVEDESLGTCTPELDRSFVIAGDEPAELSRPSTVGMRLTPSR